MYSFNELKIKFILSFFLKGHDELAQLILKHKYKIELDENREFHIENDFYNWLNFDLTHRRFLREKKLQRKSSLCNNIIVYNRLLDQLGLNHEYRRTKSLTKCFASKWWKTTNKNNIEWFFIHKELIETTIKLNT